MNTNQKSNVLDKEQNTDEQIFEQHIHHKCKGKNKIKNLKKKRHGTAFGFDYKITILIFVE